MITLLSCSDEGVLSALHSFATNKKSGYERESAAMALESLATTFGASIGPSLLPSLTILMDLYMDKGEVVRIAAKSATKTILKLLPPEATRFTYRLLEGILANGKWRTKVGALDALKSFLPAAREAVATELGTTLPKVEAAMHDTKPEVLHPLNGNDFILTELTIGLFSRHKMRYNSLHIACQS